MTATALAKDFWTGRRVFVTGHTGFKGGWLIALLRRLGAEVSGYSLPPPTTPSLFEAARIGELCSSTIGDIRDSESLAAAMRAAEPEIVLHLAARALVRPAYSEPIETFSTNVVGTAKVLECVRGVPSIGAVVVVTSDKVYENEEWPWAYREDDPLGGKEPYGASKACAEIVVAAYRYSYFSGDGHNARIATVRAGNVIGGGDWAEYRIVPDAARAFSKGRPLIVRNPEAVRPWQLVLEPLRGYLTVARALIEGAEMPERMAFNFGPVAEDSLSVRGVADRVAARWGDGARWEQAPGTQAYEARLLELDSSLARMRLGWVPRLRLDDALARAVDWYKAFYGGQDMQAFTLAQIDEYLGG